MPEPRSRPWTSPWPWAAVVLAAAIFPFVPGLRAAESLSHVTLPGSSWGFDGGLFMPLSWLSRRLGAEWPLNLLLHAVSSLLVLLAALSLGGLLKARRQALVLGAAAAALLFAVGSQRAALVLSDVGRPILLAQALLLGSFLAYLRHRELEGSSLWLGAALAGYILACLAWTGAAAFPLLLIALDHWVPVRSGKPRWPNPLSAPSWVAVSFALAAYVALVYAMNGHYLAGPPRLPRWSAGFELSRLCAGLAQTAGQFFWPREVAPFEPFFSSKTTSAAGALLVLLSGALAFKSRGAAAWLLACLGLYVAAFLAAWDPAVMIAQTDAARAAYLPTAFLLVAAAPLAAGWLETLDVQARRGAGAGAALLVLLAARASVSASLSLRGDAPGLEQSRRDAIFQAVDQLSQAGALDAEDAQTLIAASGAVGREDAIRLLQQAVKLAPDNWTAHLNLSLLLNAAGRGEEAVAQMSEAVRANPSAAVARNDLGFFLMQRGRYQEAVAQLSEAVRLDPNMALAQNNLAAAQAAVAGGLPPAERARRAQLLLNEGVGLISHGKPAEGVEKLSQAGLLDPGNPSIPFDMGVAYVQMSRFDQGEAAFRRATQLQPNSPQGHFNLGFCLHQQGRLDEAVAEYRQAIRYDPNAANAYLNAGVALTAENKLAEADQFCSKAVQLDPGAASNAHCYRKR